MATDASPASRETRPNQATQPQRKPESKPVPANELQPLPSHRGWPIVRYTFTSFEYQYVMSDPDTVEDIARIPDIKPKKRIMKGDECIRVEQTNLWLFDQNDRLSELIGAGFVEKNADGFWIVEVFRGCRVTAPENVVG